MSGNPEYSAAVDSIVRLGENRVLFDKTGKPFWEWHSRLSSRDYTILRHDLGIKAEFLGGKFAAWSIPRNTHEALVDAAKCSHGAHLLARDIVTWHLLERIELSAPLLLFNVHVLQDQYQIPKQPRRDRTWAKAVFLIVKSWDLAENFDLTCTRNDASAQISAADALSDGLARIGYAISPKAIMNWLVGTKPEQTSMRDDAQIYRQHNLIP